MESGSEFLRGATIPAARSSGYRRRHLRGADGMRQETWHSDGKTTSSFLAGDVKLIDCLKMLIDPPIEVESSCCESLAGLLTRASSTRSSLPRVLTPVAFVAPALRAYSGVGRAGFTPASQINQTGKFIFQITGRSQAKLLPNSCRTKLPAQHP
jgi:hypothetical protein